MQKPLWMWGLFLGIVLILLMLDLGIFHRKDREIGIKESLALSAFYIIISLIFGGWIWYSLGRQSGEEFLAGYLVEKSLSLDNIFVISIIFSFLQIPRKYQHRVIFWGVLGVIILRGIMIGIGATLVAQFAWILYLFAVFLIYTGFKMLFISDKPMDLNNSKILYLIKKYLPVTDKLYGNKFIVSLQDPKTKKSKLWITRLLVALIFIEFIDIMFAFDSVPAIFAITTDAYIIYTSNIFAILGLRALYFALAAVLHSFAYLKYALSLVLIFIGSKIFIAEIFGFTKFPTSISLGVTATLILGGIVVSIYITNRKTKIMPIIREMLHQSHKELVKNKFYKKFISKSNHRNYLSLNKESVSRGVAMGLLAAMVPLPIQMIIAIFLCLLVKGNLIIAALCTWITNPFTFVPLNFFIYQVGSWLTSDTTAYSYVDVFDWEGKSISQVLELSMEWLQAMGKPFLIGLPIVAIGFSILGYALTRALWGYIGKHLKSTRIR